MASVLLIDEHEPFSEAFLGTLKRIGIDGKHANSLDRARRMLHKHDFQIVFIAAQLTGHNGIYHLQEVRDTPSAPDVVVLADSSDPEQAEESIRKGAWDFLVKPVPTAALEQCVSRCLRHREARENFINAAAFHRGPIIGESRKLARAIQTLTMAARSTDNVLILGETGTGKELFARAVHDNSDRADKPFTVVDCTNLPTTLAQSLLFGHEKGTFTDAKERREGLFKQADGGTIFLDEVADLDETIQKSLLRVLQDHAFRPLSSNKEVTSDFRLVAATNRDIDDMVARKEFRPDLYFRLKACTIQLPPLRERDGDVELLVRHYVDKLGGKKGSEPKEMTEDFIEGLELYPWPGNVRELINTLRYAISNSFDADRLHSYHLPKELRIHLLNHKAKKRDAAPAFLDQTPQATREVFADEQFPTLKEARRAITDRLEAEYLIELMNRVDNDIVRACEISDLSKARLYSLLKKYDIRR